MLITTEMKTAFNQTVAEWAEKYKNQNVKRLRRKEGSGDLSRSMRYQIYRAAEDEVSQLLVYFQTHGRYLDMKRLDLAEGGEEYIDAIVEWLHTKDLNDFITQWHLKNPDREVPADVDRRIAWGIIKMRLKRKKRWRWYNKSKQAALTELANRVAIALMPATLTDVKKTFS